MRSFKRQWRNGRGGRWTARIRWYDDGGSSVRLQAENQDGLRHLWPKSVAEAEEMWREFKQKHPRLS